jgi:hypothetical protein
MSPYTIKPYYQGADQQQFEIGTRASKNWPWPYTLRPQDITHMTQVGRLSPDLRFFAFKGDQLVGYVYALSRPSQDHPSKKASIAYPTTLENHRPASRLLIQRLIATLLVDLINDHLQYKDVYAKLGFHLASQFARYQINLEMMLTCSTR